MNSKQSKEDPGQGSATALTEEELGDVSAKQLPRAAVLHETIRIQGEAELKRGTAALWWSSLAAGLSMGFSLLFKGILHVRAQNSGMQYLIESFGYTVGFLIVILARQQLFTENTITAVLPVMTKSSVVNVLKLLRLWAVVLAGNVAGAVLFAYAIQRLGLPDAATQGVLADIGRDLMANSPKDMFSKAILSGWLIATMVWLIPAAPEVKFWTILLFTYLIGVGGFPHVIVGCAEAGYLVFSGLLSWPGFLGSFMLPALAGNLVGGTLIFALVSHAQVKAE